MPLSPQPAPPPARIRWGRWVFGVLWALLVAGGYGLYAGAIPVPPHYNPWAPLNVTETPNALTPYKLARARGNRALCLAALATSGMQYDLLPDRETGAGCGFENAVRLRTAAVRFGAPLPLSCPMALSFAMWERHALQPAAQQQLGQGVVAIDNLGSYACRNINRGDGASPGKREALAGSRSRHATANALDVAGFTLSNGKRLSVLRDWDAEDTRPLKDMTPDGRLLRSIHDGACTYFKGVLGPDYNAVHRDHFHLETGGYGMCR